MTDARTIAAMTQVTVRTGGLGSWHAVHIVLSVLTAGAWLIIYAIHAAFAPRASWTTLDVPDGHEVAYRGGKPVVVGPGEHIMPVWRAALTVGVFAALIIAVVVLFAVA